jgi:hypothetical protein
MSPNTIQNATACSYWGQTFKYDNHHFLQQSERKLFIFLQKINNNYKIDVKI